MKKILIITLIGIFSLLTSTLSYAAFLVELKSGRTIFVEDYRIEGDQATLYLQSGALKIPKSDIKSIVKQKEEVERTDSPAKPDEKATEKGRVSGKGDPKGKKVDMDVESYKKRKKELQEKLDGAKEVYFNAKEKSEKDKAREVMISFSKELFALQEEVKQKNNGTLPDWWGEK